MLVDFVDESPKDVDFRMGIMPNISANQTTTIVDSKKRLSDENDMIEPKTKKTKSEKIDE